MSMVREQYAAVAETLQKDWSKRNRYEIPRLQKIVVNVGMGTAHEDKAYRELVLGSLAQITGQKPVVNKAKQSIAGFKLREGMEIGASVTLRGTRMLDFYARLVHIVLPRVRDFRGLSPRAFDGHGNYTLGLREHTVFPEISFDDVTQSHPLQITIVTTGNSDDEAREVLRRLDFPFSDKHKEADGA